jgi:hypothetical protein
VSISDIAPAPVAAGVSRQGRNCEDTKLGQSVHWLLAAQRGRGHAFSFAVLIRSPLLPPGTRRLNRTTGLILLRHCPAWSLDASVQRLPACPFEKV